MGTIIIKSKYECCISDSNLQESEETEENILEEPLHETIEAFKTLPVLPKIT
jgi:hypothetical protein